MVKFLDLKHFFGDPVVRMEFQGMFSDEQFNASLDMNGEIMRRVIEDGELKEFMPQVVAASPTGPEHMPKNQADGFKAGVKGVRFDIIPCPMPDVGERCEAMAVMGRIAYEKGIQVAAVFVQAEAWSLEGDKDSQRKYMSDRESGLAPKRIADLPPERRKEILTIGGCTLDGRHNFSGWALGHKPDGTMVVGEELWKSHFEDVREKGKGERAHCMLAEAFVTGWLTGLLVRSGKIKDDPMSEVMDALK
jgi:hypothetical protein